MNATIAMAILAFFADGCFCRSSFRTMFRGAPSATPTMSGYPHVPGQQCDGTYGCPMKVGDTGLNIGGSPYVGVLNYAETNGTSTITSTRRLITREITSTVETPTPTADVDAPVASHAPTQAPGPSEMAPDDVMIEAYRSTVYNDEGEVIYRPLPNPHDGGVMELWSQRNFHGHRTRLGRRPGVCDTVEAYVSSRVGFGRSARVLQEGVCCQLFTNRGCTGHSMMAANDVPSLGPYGMDSRVKSARCNMCADIFKGTVEEPVEETTETVEKPAEVPAEVPAEETTEETTEEGHSTEA